MAKFFQPKCSVCSRITATIEIIPPGEFPQDWNKWDAKTKKRFEAYRIRDKFYMKYSGPGGSNGNFGDPVDAEQANAVVFAFSQRMTEELIKTVDLYDQAGFCSDCAEFYCYEHWNPSTTGMGFCPKNHMMSLDPHWSPDD